MLVVVGILFMLAYVVLAMSIHFGKKSLYWVVFPNGQAVFAELKNNKLSCNEFGCVKRFLWLYGKDTYIKDKGYLLEAIPVM